MQTPKTRQFPRKFTIYLLWLYVFMGVTSLVAGVYLGLTAYQRRIHDNVPGTFYVMLVAAVICAFGLWRCILAFYHLGRLRAKGRRA